MQGMEWHGKGLVLHPLHAACAAPSLQQQLR